MPNYDVIIVGAGSVGVPTAMALAEKGVKTLVVDKHPSAGQGENKTRHRRYPGHPYRSG